MKPNKKSRQALARACAIGIALGAAACDDTASALLDESKEAATSVADAVGSAEAQAKRETQEAKAELVKAADEAQVTAKKTADGLERKVDEVDKAIAKEIKEE